MSVYASIYTRAVALKRHHTQTWWHRECKFEAALSCRVRPCLISHPPPCIHWKEEKDIS